MYDSLVQVRKFTPTSSLSSPAFWRGFSLPDLLTYNISYSSMTLLREYHLLTKAGGLVGGARALGPAHHRVHVHVHIHPSHPALQNPIILDDPHTGLRTHLQHIILSRLFFPHVKAARKTVLPGSLLIVIKTCQRGVSLAIKMVTHRMWPGRSIGWQSQRKMSKGKAAP